MEKWKTINSILGNEYSKKIEFPSYGQNTPSYGKPFSFERNFQVTETLSSVNIPWTTSKLRKHCPLQKTPLGVCWLDKHPAACLGSPGTSLFLVCYNTVSLSLSLSLSLTVLTRTLSLSQRQHLFRSGNASRKLYLMALCSFCSTCNG